MAMNNVGTDRKKYKIVLVGDSLSGKSTLLTSFLYNRFNPDHDSVFGEMFHSKTIQIDNTLIDLSLVDTPTSGIPDFDLLRPLCYRDAQTVLICFNVDDPQSITNVVEKWNPEIRHNCGRCSVILVACKIDLREDPEIISKLKQRDEKPIKTKIGKKIASKIHADAYIECSAKTHQGVQELFITAVRLVLKKPHYMK